MATTLPTWTIDPVHERITSAFRATVLSMVQLGTRASFALLGPLVGYGIDAWGLPSVLSALGILFSIAFVFPAPAAGPAASGSEPGRQTLRVTGSS
jgi:hypothetical protein